MPFLAADTISRQLEELNLLKCSLLNGEELSFIPFSSEAEIWDALLDAYPDQLEAQSSPESSAKFQIKCSDFPIWFEVQLPTDFESSGSSGSIPGSMVSVRGGEISRAEQERWQQIIKECSAEVHDSECVVLFVLPWGLGVALLTTSWYVQISDI